MKKALKIATISVLALLLVALVVIAVIAVNKPVPHNATGRFYSLKEGFDSGYITVEDLQAIADLNNNFPKGQDVLDEETKAKIIDTEVIRLKGEERYADIEVNSDGIGIYRYYGEYNGYYAVILGNTYFSYPAVDYNIVVEIGGVTFRYWDPRMIELWREFD